jgi:hypothetical protein
MFKRLTSILLGVLVLSSLLTGMAFAEDSAPTTTQVAQGRRMGGGEITALGEDNFTVTGPRGNSKVIYVDSGTQFMDADGNLISFADVEIGERAFIAAARREGDRIVGVWVRIFPAPTHYKGVGTVDSVDAGEQAFEFTNRRGQHWEFYTDANTQFTDRDGGTHAFDEIEAGARLFVKAELRADGQWWATVVGFPLGDEPAKP